MARLSPWVMVRANHVPPPWATSPVETPHTQRRSPRAKPPPPSKEQGELTTAQTFPRSAQDPPGERAKNTVRALRAFGGFAHFTGRSSPKRRLYWVKP